MIFVVKMSNFILKHINYLTNILMFLFLLLFMGHLMDIGEKTWYLDCPMNYASVLFIKKKKKKNYASVITCQINE